MYTLVTFVLGGLSDLVGHMEFGGHTLDTPELDAGSHEMGDLGAADAQWDMAHADSIGHAGEGSHAGSHGSLLGYLSPLAIAGFLLGFGGVGVVSRLAGAGAAGSLTGAFTGGLSM